MLSNVFDFVMKLEGGLVLHKNATEDTETYAGIFRSAHPDWIGWTFLDNKEIPPIHMVQEVYEEKFWNRINLDDGLIKGLIFEYGVNAGLDKAIKTAQLVAGVTVDGVLGPKSKEAIEVMDSDIFLTKYSLERVKHYTHLANKDSRKYGIYLRGWINRVLDSHEWFETNFV